MRLQFYITLLFLVLYYAGANNVEARLHDEKARDLKITPAPNRLLRSLESAAVDKSNTNTADEEERSGVLSRLAQLDEEMSKLRKVDVKITKFMISVGYDPTYLFKHGKYAKAWPNINNRKETVLWFRFTKAFRDKKGVEAFPDEEIFKLLNTRLDDETLAITFESLKRIPDLKNLAESLQKYQFKLWIKQGDRRSHYRASV